ncbi:GntR family transcriptional regulator [Mitsuokella multacida]|uniref:GntR family transcriptional regulator n=1 Tax=Mitsuokella multacida TaxID=52226 RepID=UPI002665C930|nr:GntR family transcriptional regulator [Mitsuokella multacida]
MIKKVSYKDQVYQYLKRAIIKGELQTGVIYSEQQFADKLEVSRTPVREAVIRLTNEGMLEVYTNRGWGVKDVSTEDMQEILQARIAIEGYSLRYLVRHRDESSIQEVILALQKCQKDSENFAQDESHHFEYMKADIDFHCLIVECTGNAYLKRINDQMRTKIEQATYNSLHMSHRNAKACLEHQRILEEILHGDEDSATQAFMQHMQETALVLGTTLLQ